MHSTSSPRGVCAFKGRRTRHRRGCSKSKLFSAAFRSDASTTHGVTVRLSDALDKQSSGRLRVQRSSYTASSGVFEVEAFFGRVPIGREHDSWRYCKAFRCTRQAVLGAFARSKVVVHGIVGGVRSRSFFRPRSDRTRARLMALL